MTILLITGAGLGIAGFLSWLAERRPHLLTSAVAVSASPDKTGFALSLPSIVFVMAVGLAFYGLSAGSYPTDETIRCGVLLVITSAAACFDMHHGLIPNRLMKAGILAWCVLVITGLMPGGSSLVAGMAGALLFLLVRGLGFRLYQKPGMGMGDIKLIFVMGLFLDWEVFWAIYLAMMAGGLWAAAGLKMHKLDKQDRLPFAPFLWIGATLSALLLPFNRFMDLWM